MTDIMIMIYFVICSFSRSVGIFGLREKIMSVGRNPKIVGSANRGWSSVRARKSLVTDNVSSISGVHYRDNANLCNKLHIAYRAYRNCVAHDMIIRCYVSFLNSISCIVFVLSLTINLPL